MSNKIKNGKSRALRVYEPSWILLKKNRKLVLKVMPPFVVLVQRAIRKEKEMDTMFKIDNAHDKLRIQSSYDLITNKLTFILKQQFGLEEPVVK